MKADAKEILNKVEEILYTCQRIRPEQIKWMSDLKKDFGISGDDADFLFMEINKSFKVEWVGLQLAVHFGSEPTLFPLPWALNWQLYERQPFRVCDLVNAIQTGRWQGTPLVRRKISACILLYAVSTLQWLFILFIVSMVAITSARR